MRNKALQAVEQYQMLPQGSRVTVALSGGADSVALLHFLCSLQKERMLGLQACHINHLLRAEESERDEAFVRKLAEEYHLFITGGSDFHGANKPDIELGRGTGNLRVPVMLLENLR